MEPDKSVIALQERFDILLAAHAREHELLATALILAKENSEARLNGYIESHGQAHQSMQRALDVALSALEARLAGMNEFRAQIKDMINTLVTRTEWSAGRDASQVRMDIEIKAIRAEQSSMSRLIWMASGAFAILVIGLQFVKH